MKSKFPVAAVVAIILLLLGVIFGQPEPVRFDPKNPTAATTLLASLLIVALLVERSLEVFVHTWRGEHADELDRAVQETTGALKALIAGADVTKATDDLTRAVAARKKDWIDTRRMTLWAGSVLGVALSAAGYRALENLLSPESVAQTGTGVCWIVGICIRGSLQLTTFRVLDVLVTGGVIGGGSDGIHKIIQLYSDYMQAKSDNISSAAKS